ncbi:kappa-carrageenase [Pelagicoccus mobilis]|uniref:Family 16 glycosylhydrolase n=1 Tax=Pelagicoccus mobilis TaxID=415221 RepID=A0A934VR95_9BACT|nr:kappa-carrageenase [Pelagicoccus mobilis]MBK1879157.1 family 16 glycosylhydrolase [Pelagicoccus mobilis]
MIRQLSVFFSVILVTSLSAKDVQPVGVGGNWKLVEAFSDEFDGKAINEKKWDHRLKPWGERSWTPDNVWQKDGNLHIRARYEEHARKGKEYFYKMGILRSRQKTTYGYFEARIKGCDRFPGLCPAFWLYSYGVDRNPDYPHVTYSEIDIVEMQQNNYLKELKGKAPVNHIDCNLHTRVLDENGVEKWIRPQQRPDLCAHHYTAPWDPRDDFHLYAAEVTPDKITWYIDGKEVASAENVYWHLPMAVTLTMEARPPLIKWANGGRVPVPENVTPEGFPTEMVVDYVRVWERIDSFDSPISSSKN